MFTKIVSDLYIGKSKISFQVNDKCLPKETPVKEILLPTGFKDNLPDYGTIGNLWQTLDGDKFPLTFEVTPLHPDHKIFVTGIPKGAILDDFRLNGVIWSSYYEDNIRGYLFQVIPYEVEPKLI